MSNVRAPMRKEQNAGQVQEQQSRRSDCQIQFSIAFAEVDLLKNQKTNQLGRPTAKARGRAKRARAFAIKFIAARDPHLP